jgi:drug/metabolite transporter (DMT)-like permease
VPDRPQAAGSFSGVATITLTLAGWTSIPLFLRYFKDYIDPWTANGWRYGVSALIWLPVVLLAASRGTAARNLWRAALVPSLFNAVAQVCFAIAPYYVAPGLMTFSMRLQIVFLTLGAALLFAAERRVIGTRLFLTGVGMVILGTFGTLLLGEQGLSMLRGGTGLGISLSVGAGLLYAGYSLSVRHFMHGIPALQAFAAVSQYTAAIIVTLMLIFGRRHGMEALDLSGQQFGMLMLSAVIGIGIGHTLYYVSIARLGLAVASGVVQLQPVTVSIGSYLVFRERLTPAQWAAGLVAVGGAVVMLYGQHHAARRREEAEREVPAAVSEAGA